MQTITATIYHPFPNRLAEKKLFLGVQNGTTPMEDHLAVFIKITKHISFGTEIPFLEFIPQMHTWVPTTQQKIGHNSSTE